MSTQKNCLISVRSVYDHKVSWLTGEREGGEGASNRAFTVGIIT